MNYEGKNNSKIKWLQKVNQINNSNVDRYFQTNTLEKEKNKLCVDDVALAYNDAFEVSLTTILCKQKKYACNFN